MRAILAAATALALAGCSAAGPVDTVLVYAREAPSAPVTVMAAANGDARVEAGDTVFIRRDGTDYAVLTDGKGSYAARTDDVIAIFGEDQRALLSGPRPQPDYVLSEHAPESVAGIRGRLWKVAPKDVPSLPAAEAVVSDDPALAPAARALAMQSSFNIRRNAGMAGGPGKLETAMLQLFDKGLVLRFGTALRLDRIHQAPIAPDKFTLPAAVLDKAGLRLRLAAERKRLDQSSMEKPK